MYPKARRRLAQWIDEEGVKAYGIRIKPFWLKSGTYAYYSDDKEDEQMLIEQSISSGTVLIANTVAALAVDLPGALVIFVLGIIADFFVGEQNWWKFTDKYDENLSWGERIKGLFHFRQSAHGFSGVFNVLAGYLAYSVIFDKDARKIWLPWVGAIGTIYSNLKVLYEEKKGLGVPANHYAHFGGMVYGFLFAALIHRFWRKKTQGVGFLRRHDGKVTLLFLGLLFYMLFTHEAGKKREAEKLAEQNRPWSELS